MNPDLAKIDDAVLALLTVFSDADGSTWKGHDFGVLGRLFEQQLISNPRGKQKSLRVTRHGLERGRELVKRLFELDMQDDKPSPHGD